MKAVLVLLLVNVVATDQYHVAINSMPAKDGWDKAAVLLTFALVVIGAVTFAVVLYQAIQTKRATDAAKEAAEPARLSAAAFINSERSWIMSTRDKNFQQIRIFPLGS